MPCRVNSFKAQLNEKRHHNNIGVNTHMYHSDGQVRLNPDLIPLLYPGSIVPGDKGRHHYPPMHSQAKEWKASMRQNELSRAYGSEAEERGKKPLPRPAPKPQKPQCKMMIVNEDGSFAADRRGVEIKGLCVGFKSLKHFEARKEAPEYDMETFMNKKQRAGGSIERMRNGVGVAAPGDKPFKCAEHEPGYYAAGGLIPGSSIQLRKSAKPERRAGEATTTGMNKTGEKKLSYREKLKLAEEEYDLQQVAQLTQVFERQGNEVPSFEKRTGMYLVKPEDEAY